MPLFHAPITDSCAWHGQDMLKENRWQFHLNADDIAEIDQALEMVHHRNLSWHKMTKQDFPLTVLAEKLTKIADELEHGTGLTSLKGLPVERYDETNRRRLWFGLGLHLGNPVYQDCNQLLMRDICDDRQDTDTIFNHHMKTSNGDVFVSSKARTLSNRLLRFHTDRCDVVALLCVQKAAKGGMSQIASSVAVHNAILERRPDLLECLYTPYYRSRLGEEKGGETQTYPLPVFGLRDGKFTSHYSRTYIEAAQEMDSVPRMSDKQWEALDLLHTLAKELCFEMAFSPGDIQFLNNHVIYHARSAFEDDPIQEGRLLHRLWLSMPNSRALPEDHAALWRNINAGALRGGIGQVDENPRMESSNHP